MSEMIRVLQLGTEDWNEKYAVPAYVKITFAEMFEKAPKTLRRQKIYLVY